MLFRNSGLVMSTTCKPYGCIQVSILLHQLCTDMLTLSSNIEATPKSISMGIFGNSIVKALIKTVEVHQALDTHN